MRKPLDVSQMTIQWVQQTKDPLFASLDRSERYLLYQIYVQQLDKATIAEALGCSAEEVTKKHEKILGRLRSSIEEEE